MSFFKETALYREMLLLEFITNHKNISQTDMAKHIDVGVGMVNNYINDLEEKGYLIRDYQSKKVVHYNITNQGIKRKQYLQIRYVKELMDMYLKGQDTINHFLNTIEEKKLQKILLYGAGDVAGILLDMISGNEIQLDVVGIIDDNTNKVGQTIKGIPVITLNDIDHIEHDGIVITSYAYEDKIIERLNKKQYPKHKIVKYFGRE